LAISTEPHATKGSLSSENCRKTSENQEMTMTDVNRTVAYISPMWPDHGGRSAWGAIFAGTVIGLAVFAMLSLLGLGLGLSAIEVDADDPLGMVPSASPVWLFFSQLVALGAGGFVAGRLAGVLHGIGVMLHGATVWALSTLVAAWLAVSAGMGLFNMAGSAINVAGSVVSSGASATGNAVQAIIPDDINLPDLAVSQIGMEDLPDAVATKLRANGITPANFRDEAREAFRSVISRAEQPRAREAISRTATDILQSPMDAKAEIQQLADTLVGGENAIISDEDRTEAIRVIERRLGLTQQEAAAYADQVQARLDEARANAESAIDEVQQTLDEMQTAAVNAADKAADTAATAALLAALASLLGLLAAAGGAYAGRPVDID
jgi:hypothetical protein